jgi:hypothetical protein
MFGPVMTRDTAMSDGSFRRTDKRGRGLWTPQARRDFNGVSAVLVFPRDDIWHLRSPKWQPLLARNPTARHPLPNDFLPFNELIVHELNEEVRLGRNFADLLGLPDPWPPLSALSGT